MCACPKRAIESKAVSVLRQHPEESELDLPFGT